MSLGLGLGLEYIGGGGVGPSTPSMTWPNGVQMYWPDGTQMNWPNN